ncbi:uncharacterized protein DS421_14g482020 [Arachis hypogaea]|nr:uncharacterized protein DS421_14g482020 [Arachis hypogaea]
MEIEDEEASAGGKARVLKMKFCEGAIVDDSLPLLGNAAEIPKLFDRKPKENFSNQLHRKVIEAIADVILIFGTVLRVLPLRHGNCLSLTTGTQFQLLGFDF